MEKRKLEIVSMKSWECCYREATLFFPIVDKKKTVVMMIVFIFYSAHLSIKLRIRILIVGIVGLMLE